MVLEVGRRRILGVSSLAVVFGLSSCFLTFLR
jgi:hypothetical protein